MIILAIDYAHRKSGWVIINDGRTENFGEFGTKPSKKKLTNKLAWIEHELYNVNRNQAEITELIRTLSPDRLIVEIPYFSQKSSDAILIGMGAKMISDLDAILLTGQLVKSILTGKKQASKDIIRSIVRKTAVPAPNFKSILFASNHIHDAYATYLAYINPKYQILSKASAI